MLEGLIASQALLWLIVVILSLVCLALIRQVGILYERIAPAGALAMNQQLAGGDSAPYLSLTTIAGAAVSIGQQATDSQKEAVSGVAKSQLVFFLSPSCPVCKTLLPIIKSIGKHEQSWLSIILASDGDDTATHQRFIEKHQLERMPYIVSASLGITYGVSKLPYGVLIDEKGVISALGIVNTREHLESLFEAKWLGQSTIQDYLSEHEAEGKHLAYDASMQTATTD